MKCFTLENLTDFALGRLPDDEAFRVETHLAECADCEETVSSLDEVTDSLLRKIKEPAARSRYADDSVYLSALQQAQHPNPVSVLSESGPEIESASTDAPPLRMRDYQLQEPLGHGGMGTVYRALHVRLQRCVAFKLLPTRRLRDSTAVARFEREMQAVGQLDHPAIVRAMDAGEIDGQHFLAMELVDGVDLARLVRHHGPLDRESACELVRQAAVGLEYVHRHGIVHRDIKPSNLMLSRQAQCKILDLGLALLDGVHGAHDELTTVGQLMGTLDYMAPEQFQDSHEVDRRADVYGLGATLYKLLSGLAPYCTSERRSPLQKLKAIATEPVTPLRSRKPEIDAALAIVVHRALSHDLNERYATAIEFAEALAPWAREKALDPWVERLDSIPSGVEMYTGAPSRFDAFVQPTPVPTQHRKTGKQTSDQAEAVPSPPPGRGSNGWRRMLGILGGVLGVTAVVAAGVILSIEMGKGKLVVHSPEDDVQVVLLGEGKNEQHETLEQGANSIRLRSGNYELRISDSAGNSKKLKVTNGSFVLERGETWRADIRIEQPDDRPERLANQPSPQAENQANAGPLATVDLPQSTSILSVSRDNPEPHLEDRPRYELKTLDQWVALESNLLTSTDDGINAVRTLARSEIAENVRINFQRVAELVAKERGPVQLQLYLPTLCSLAITPEENQRAARISFAAVRHNRVPNFGVVGTDRFQYDSYFNACKSGQMEPTNAAITAALTRRLPFAVYDALGNLKPADIVDEIRAELRTGSSFTRWLLLKPLSATGDRLAGWDQRSDGIETELLACLGDPDSAVVLEAIYVCVAGRVLESNEIQARLRVVMAEKPELEGECARALLHQQFPELTFAEAEAMVGDDNAFANVLGIWSLAQAIDQKPFDPEEEEENKRSGIQAAQKRTTWLIARLSADNWGREEIKTGKGRLSARASAYLALIDTWRRIARSPLPPDAANQANRIVQTIKSERDPQLRARANRWLKRAQERVALEHEINSQTSRGFGGGF